MKTRKEAAAFAARQLEGTEDTSREKAGRHHYGAQDLRDLLDFIYENSLPAQEDWLVQKHPAKPARIA